MLGARRRSPPPHYMTIRLLSRRKELAFTHNSSGGPAARSERRRVWRGHLSGIGFLGKEGKRSGKTPLSATMNKSKAHRKQENGYALPGSIIAVVARGVNRLCPSK